MLAKAIGFVMLLGCSTSLATAAPLKSAGTTREFRVASGGTLKLDLEAGAEVQILGTGDGAVSVTYSASCTPDCEVLFEESSQGLTVKTRFAEHGSSQNSDIDLAIQVPRRFDVEVDSKGGGVTIDGVEGTFTGKTMGGELTLHDVRGTAELSTMGGEIELTDSDLDGSLKTMGGEVTFQNVVGDVKGSSMGGDVRYKNVRRRDGQLGSPPRIDGDLAEAQPDTVQISTMGGTVEVEDAPEGADLQTMGGDIEVKNAGRFVRAKTMGGDIVIDSVDGWVQATTMGGNVDVTVVGSGGDVSLSSNSGEITLTVPPGFGMNLDLEIAFTRNSSKEYRIAAPGISTPSVTPEWDHDHGTPRKYVRASSAANGGGHSVKIRTINGDITVREAD